MFASDQVLCRDCAALGIHYYGIVYNVNKESMQETQVTQQTVLRTVKNPLKEKFCKEYWCTVNTQKTKKTEYNHLLGEKTDYRL